LLLLLLLSLLPKAHSFKAGTSGPGANASESMAAATGSRSDFEGEGSPSKRAFRRVA